MALLPRKGGLYWYVTDIWETFAALPVVVVRHKRSRPNSQIKVRLAGLSASKCTEYEYLVSRNALYKSHKKAKAEASKLNERRLQHETD